MPSGLAALIPNDIVEDSKNNNNYYWPTAINFDEGYMYISFAIPKTANSDLVIASGEKFYTWKINMETFESSWFSITNTTGTNLTWYSGTYGLTPYNPCVIVSNNYTLVHTGRGGTDYFGTGSMYIIDNATSSTIKQVVDSDDVTVRNKYFYNYFTMNDIVYGFEYTNSNPGRLYVINLKTGVMKYIANAHAGTLFYSSNYCGGITYGTSFPKIIMSMQSNGMYLGFYMNPMYLLTINNLEDVVTKTSAETMKVTYIITQEAEE